MIVNIPFLSPTTLPDSKLTLGKPAAQQIFSNKTHKPESTPVSSKLGFCRSSFGLKNVLMSIFTHVFQAECRRNQALQKKRVGPGCRHQLVCREQDGVSLLLPENRRAKDLGRKLVLFWRPLRCFCFNHTRRVSIEERTIEALKNGTQAVISDGEIKTLYKDLCSGGVKSGLTYLWHNPGVSLKLKQRLKPLMFHFADAQVDELTERIGSCSGIDKLIKKREFQFLDLVFDVLVPEVQRRLQQ
ncbi:uncharacterized protein [Nothobranchius furzeri]